MTTTGTPAPARPAGPRRPRRPADDWVSLFPELYRSAFTAAHSELGDRGAAEEVTLQTLARAHARWSRIGDSPVGWVSMAARTQALDLLQRQPPGREVLLGDETELTPGEIPGPGPGDFEAVTRRGTWLRRRRLAGWAAAGACVVAAAILAVGLGNSLPPAPRDPIQVPATAGIPTVFLDPDTGIVVVPPVAPDYTPITGDPRPQPDLTFGQISAGRSEQGSVRVTFRRAGFTVGGQAGQAVQRQAPAEQLVIDPDASLLTRDPTDTAGTADTTGTALVSRTPAELVRHLNRATPGGRAEVWVRLGPDGKITALREE